MIKEINVSEIIKYRRRRASHYDYDYGGWYMIEDTQSNKKYIGKSIEYMERLRQHVTLKNPKTVIDKNIKEKGIDFFKFYLLDKYENYNICFHTRKNETKIEHSLIGKHKTNHPFGYNMTYYEWI